MNKLVINLLALTLLSSAKLLCADEQVKTEPQTSLELLEFLGNFSTADGQWQDPLEVSRMLDETPINVDEQTEKSE